MGLMGNQACTLVLKGELDHHGAHVMLREIEKTVDQNLPGALILDFGQVSFMDSSAIAVIVNANRLMSEIDGSLSIVNMPEQGARVMRAAGIDRILKIDGLVSGKEVLA